MRRSSVLDDGNGRTHIQKIDGPFLHEFKGSPARTRRRLTLALDRG